MRTLQALLMASIIYLLVVDTHSQWPKVIKMTSTTAQRTIAIFAACGLPQQLASDNGSQFTSDAFATLILKDKHIRCAPYHPGAAERLVQTFKK